jgi:hypothetical protein
MTTFYRRLLWFLSRLRAMTRPLSGFFLNKKPSFATPETPRRNRATALLAALIFLAALQQCRAGELTISRDALQRTLKQQLFSASNGRYYLKGNPQSACFISAEDPKLSFEQDRIVVRMVTHARLGHQVAGACIGVNLAFPAQVSLAPDAEGETIGFRDARLDKVSDQKEINFVLSPFLRRQVPSGMKVNAAELIRGALAGSTVSSGYKVSLERLKIHSIVIQGDALIVDVDGDLSIK